MSNAALKQTTNNVIRPAGRLRTTRRTGVTPRPFLKWVGGKTQLLDQIFAELPEKIGNYHEPFMGVAQYSLAYFVRGAWPASALIYLISTKNWSIRIKQSRLKSTT